MEIEHNVDGIPCSADHIELLKKKISGWLRQSRYRSRKSNIEVDIDYQDVVDIYNNENFRCSYCGELADSPDHPFPIKEKGPCVLANVVPCCDRCRNKKKNHSLMRFFQDNHITSDQLSRLIKKLVKRKGGRLLLAYMKNNFANDSKGKIEISD